jgi:hypothetical protein
VRIEKVRSRRDPRRTLVNDLLEALKNRDSRRGAPGLLLRDLRRSAVRNLERAGISRSVAMKLTGHKTEAVKKLVVRDGIEPATPGFSDLSLEIANDAEVRAS